MYFYGSATNSLIVLNWTRLYLLLLFVKICFEMSAGTIAVAVLAAIYKLTDRRVFVIGAFSGFVRWLVVDVLLYFLVIICARLFGQSNKFDFLYLLIVTLCLWVYPLVVAAAVIHTFRNLHILKVLITGGGCYVAGVFAVVPVYPALILNIREMRRRRRITRIIKEKEGLRDLGMMTSGVYFAMKLASMLETHHVWESGYIVGEVAIGAVLGLYLRNSGIYRSNTGTEEN